MTTKRWKNYCALFPRRLFFEDQGKEGQSERIAFHPNPGFKPKSYEQRILHALEGIVFIDLFDKRIARLSGSLGTRVQFGYGVIGHVEQGGTTDITRVHLSPGVWKTRFSCRRRRWRHPEGRQTRTDRRLVLCTRTVRFTKSICHEWNPELFPSTERWRGRLESDS